MQFQDQSTGLRPNRLKKKMMMIDDDDDGSPASVFRIVYVAGNTQNSVIYLCIHQQRPIYVFSVYGNANVCKKVKYKAF